MKKPGKKLQLCEGCGKKSANYGLQADKKRRWCGSCAKRYGAISLQKMCEDCGKKWAHCGL